MSAKDPQLNLSFSEIGEYIDTVYDGIVNPNQENSFRIICSSNFNKSWIDNKRMKEYRI